MLLNAFRRIFSKAQNRKARRASGLPRLELFRFEDRIVPTVVASMSGTDLVITTNAGEDIVSIVAAAGGVITINATSVGGTAIQVTGTVTGTIGGTAGASTITLTTPGNLTGINLVGDATGNQDFTITGISGSANYNSAFGLSVNMGADAVGLDTLNFTTSTVTLGTGNLATSNIDAINIAAAADITAFSGTVGISATTISTAGDVTTNSGLTTYTGAVTLTGAIANASTTGGVTFSSTVNGAFGITTTASGAAPITFTGIVGGTTPVGAISVTTVNGAISAAAITATSLAISEGAGNVSVGALTTTGAVSITSTGTIGLTGAVSAASVATVGAGAVTLGGAVTTIGAISFAGVVGSSSPISVTSSADSVAFGSTVSSSTGGVSISTATAGKTISLAAAVTAALNSNILLIGDVLSNSASAATLNTSGNGNITITGKVDALTAGNDLTLSAGSGTVTLTGNIGSSTTAFGDLIASGTGIFLASGTVNVEGVDLDEANDFGTSITFAKAVTATGALNTDGVVVAAAGAATVTFSDAITVSGTASSSDADIIISSVSGAISVVGAITGLDSVTVSSTSGAITLSGAITTSGTNTAGNDGDIVIGTGTSGNVLLSGNISTTGTGDIELDNDGTGTLTITGNVSTAATSATNGDIFIGVDTTGAATGAGTVVTINGTVTTTGTTAGDIFIGVNGASVAVNKAVTAGATGNVVFITTLATDAITIASGANITAGDSVFDGFVTAAGIINLGANITAGTASVTQTSGISLDNLVNLTGAVSLKTQGTGANADINLASVNGNQNLTLEATSSITLTSVGQTSALNTITVTNSGGVSAGPLTAANVVLSDTTGSIVFNGSTVITTSLTTSAKAYNVTFAGTTSLAGTPVFLNTGNVTFAGTTNLTTGATIIGNAATTVNLAGTIVSSEAFNIGALPLTTTIADGTQLTLNSTTAASTIANPITLTGSATLSLLGVGTLTLSGDSSTGITTNDNISVINGTLNVTGKIGAASTSTVNGGTISGAGGTIGALTVNTGTVAPGGTLKTAAVTLNAATNYSAAVLTTTTASNLETFSAINLGGSVLSLSSVAAGLAVGNTFTIINNTHATTAITGTFANQAEGSSISAKDTAGNTVSFTVSYIGGTGNDVTLKVANVFGIATQATLSTPAAGAPSGSAFTTQPVITIKDAAGNTVTNSTASVTMTVSSGATTVGTTTINAVAGIATFTNAGISGANGTPYTLTFTSGSLTTATQSITPGTFTVINNSDSGAGSLRQAILDANNTPGNDLIIFNLTGPSPYTITLGSALPTILNASTIVGAGTRGTLTITGPGATTLTISGNNGDSGRNFHILSIDTGGNLAISGVTFSGAKTTGAGGAIENAGTLTVSGSTITGNSANDGGGITNWGTLTVINTTISGNTSITQAGGGIQNSSGSLTVTNSTISGNTAATQAGGIQNNGILVVTNSTISGNTALTRTGGGIYNFTSGTLTLSGTTIAGNSANDGGGIRNLGALNISNTIIANSTSGGDYAGGGSIGTNSNNLVEDGTLPGTSEITGDPNLGPLQNNAGPTFTMALLSGSVAIGAGNATISNAVPINGKDQRGVNRTTSDIGAYSFGIQVTNTSDSNTVGSGSLRAAINLANTTAGDDQISFNLSGVNTITLGSALPTIVDASTVVGSGTAGKTGINGLGASLLIISGSDPTNANNETRNFSIFRIASGGDLSISGVTVSGAKTSGRGGAFKNSGTLTVINSTISGNTATNGGGGIVNYGTLTVSNSTLSSNTSTSGGGGIVNNSGTFSIYNSTISGNTTSTGAGGGINNNNFGTLTVINSTISGNTANTNGGGIFNDSVTMVINSTISGNTAGTGGGINNNFGGTLNIANSIIANSITGGDYAGGGTIGTIGINSNILVEDGTLPGTREITGDPNLGPLQNNGGTTFTMALGTGSVAIGAGDATISNDRPINGKDQRGVTRSPTTPSIGAFEYILATQATLTTPAAGSASGSAFTTQPIITIKDTFGNTVNTNVSVTMTVSSGATTLGTTTINAVAGIATFTNVGISGIDGTPYTLTFTSTGLTIATQTITITTTFGTATQVILTTPALGSASGSAFTTQPVITIKDAAGNIVTNSTASVTMTVSSGATTLGTTTINAVAGIATFTNVGISGIAGTPYTLTFTSTGLTFATQSITPTFGTATQATLTTPALGSASGSAFSTQPIITIKDTFGNTVNTNVSVTMTVSSGATTVGTTTINAVAGIATFAGVGISGTAGTPYTLTFTSTGLTIATQTITPTFGIATQATLTSPALGSASGSAFTTQPVITIKDAFGNIVTNSTASVTMTVSSGATTLGITTINAVAGIATFTNVGISGIAGTRYTLTFTSTGLTVATQSITPTFGTATQATLTTPALGSASGSAFTTQPVITLKDTFGNTVNTNVSVTMTVSSGATTVGTTTINAVAGIATFTNVGISGIAGTPYTLTFTSTGLTVATQTITPTFGLATQATITTPALGSPSGSAFTTQPIITIKDSAGNTVTNSTASVTMAVSGANGLATTVGTTTINAVAGIATFAGVGISGTAGTPYTLTFTSTGLTIATQTITPTFGIATQAPLTTNPAGAPSGSAFTTQPVITIKDTFGNTVTNSTASVTMTVSSGDNKATTVGAFTINAVAGVATFTNVGISGTDGTSYTLTFTSGSFTATQSITATFGLATQAILTTQAAGSASGSAFTTQPVITIKDAFGNTVTNSTASVTMSVSRGDNKATTVGAFTINAVAGIATFTNVGISGTAGTPYTLTFISTGLTIPTQTITPTFGLATQATLTTPASGAPSGLAFIIQPVITINDTFGNPITNSTASVTMTVSSGASTVGTTAINAVAGIATFTNVGISGAAGNSYTLTFTSGSLATATQTITPAFGPAIQISSPSEPIPFPLGVSSTKDLVILTGINPATISGYVATIVWGDGSQNSAGTIALSPNQSGVFQVLGTHTYSSLELFNGSVSVTSVFDNRIFSSNFNVEVLTAAQKEKISDISAEVLPPGGKTADVTISGVINSFYKQSANNSSPVILFTASYVSNPQPYATAAPAQSFFDVRLRNPDPGAVLTLTANFSGGLQRGSSPYIQFAQDTSTSYQNVVSSNNLVVINYINNTITVLIDQNSFPLINNLRGTVFAVVTGATQVSSNTITVLPAAFTSGTAVGIAWGASSTLVDVATSANASNTTLTFQNSRKTTLSLAPSQSKGTVILRTVNNGGKTNEEASKETIKQLTNPDILQSIIRGTIGIGPEVIGGMIKKMLPENAGSFLKQWSKVVSEIKGVPNDMITSKVNAIPQTNNGSSTDKPEECDDTLFEDAVFDDISKISSALGLVDESIPCLNGVSLDSMLEELAFCGEINWAGLALSTLTLSQFRTFPKDNSKRVRPIKVGSM